MTSPAARLRDWPERFLGVAWWAVPPVAAIWFYWLGVKTWFWADDFAWLTHTTEFYTFREFLYALFKPMAEGTIRPFGDRLFFIVFYRLFGLDPLPFHICIGLTQCANLVLLAAIARRLTGSRLAAFAAALLWIANTAQPMVMGWAAAYNQPLCALFLLGAFFLLLRFIDTGRRRYWVWQWVVFVLGFGALELNVVYPALAMAYTFLCARRFFRRTVPLVAGSILFVIVHRILTGITSPLYQMHFGMPMLRTLWTYWTWTLGPAYYASVFRLPPGRVVIPTILLTAGIVALLVCRALRRDYLPLFFILWYVAAIALFLPLSDHLTEYYPFLAAAGPAMLGGYAVVLALHARTPVKAVAVLLLATYLGYSIPTAKRSSRWMFEHSRDVRKLVLGVARAHELHPGSLILLDGVDDLLFWHSMRDKPFPLVGALNVYLTPGSEKRIMDRPALGDVSQFIIPPGPAWNALMRDEAVVYDTRGERLRNVTSLYARSLPAEWEHMIPRRIEPGNPAEAYLLGSGWHNLEGNHRWMSRRAAVRMAGPAAPGAGLYLSGDAVPIATKLAATVDGVPLGERPFNASEEFHVEWDLPAAVVGKPVINVEIEIDRTVTPPIDGRELGAAFGVIEIREK